MGGLIFREETHQYFLDGVELPSVTKIARFLSADVAEHAKPWLRDDAARRGTLIHAACEALDYGLEPDDLPVEYLPYLDAYQAFLRDYRVHGWFGIEVPMGSLSLGFAGTLDRLGQIDQTPAIVDLKTGSTLHTQTLSAQLTGYAQLCAECRPGPRPALYGLHLRPDGKYTLRRVEYAPDLFAACLTLHHALVPKKGRISCPTN